MRAAFLPQTLSRRPHLRCSAASPLASSSPPTTAASSPNSSAAALPPPLHRLPPPPRNLVSPPPRRPQTFSPACSSRRTLNPRPLASASNPSAGDEPMEVEVKLRLPDAAAHRRLSDALSPHHCRTHLQENIFFDDVNNSLAAGFAALRIRFYDKDGKCVISLKSRPSIVGGVSRVEEVEEEIDPAVGRTCTADPEKLFGINSDIMKKVTAEFGEGLRLRCLGGFQNVRSVYQWEGLVLELDETRYAFGTCYELECETSEPEMVRDKIERFLKKIGVDYKYAQASKFAAFRAGRMLP